MATNILPGMVISMPPGHHLCGTETLVMWVDERTGGPDERGWIEVAGRTPLGGAG